MSKKCLLPAKQAFEIHFLTQLCRVKKYFYPSKCLGDDLRSYAGLAAKPPRRARGADVRRKSPVGTFSTVSNPSRRKREGFCVLCLFLDKCVCGSHRVGRSRRLSGDLVLVLHNEQVHFKRCENSAAG